MDKEDNIKILKARIGNLEVQISEYQQIIKELSDKLQAYDKKMGSVFVKSHTESNNY
jgi:prefoldin subunit 5